ncbi:hypothetical protein ACRYHF_11405 [Stutzerimonas balearica]|uniref:hypothetical protein n=1 Tax=Stutzerimonas balearica TaxID=74829 RepID=UPI003F5BA802
MLSFEEVQHRFIEVKTTNGGVGILPGQPQRSRVFKGDGRAVLFVPGLPVPAGAAPVYPHRRPGPACPPQAHRLQGQLLGNGRVRPWPLSAESGRSKVFK